MAAMEEQRFAFTPVRNQPLRASRKTLPVYDKLHRAELYYQVVSNKDLEALERTEAALRDVKGVAKSRSTVRFDDQTSAVIFGENHDSLPTLIRHYRREALPPCLVKNYIAQICAICIELHDRGFVLQGALQLNSFAKEATDNVFLMSSFGVQPASEWRSDKANPLYLAPELICSMSTTKLNSCDMFAADAYSVGLCGLILATGRIPFTLPYTKSFTAKDMLEAKLRHNPEIPDDLDKDLRCLLVHLLERSPSKRMSLHEAILHPALQRYMDPHIRFSSPALAAAILRGRIQDSSNSSSRDSGTLGPAFQGSETRVVEENCYAMEAAALKFIRSPTPPPVLCLDASAEPFSLWLAEPTGNINDDKSSSSRSRRRISSNNKHDEDDNNGRSKL